MKWKQYTPHTKDPNLGKVVSVFLNEDETMVKRYFAPGMITASGKQTIESPEYIETKWNNETKSLLRFQNKPWVPKLIEINEKDRYVIQEYYGPCLLFQKFDDIPNLHNQIIEIYQNFKDLNLYKLNGSLANTTRNGDQLIMFDFKFMQERTPELKHHAEREIDLWLKKFGTDLVPKLKELL